MSQEEFNILKNASGQTLIVMKADDLMEFCRMVTEQNKEKGEYLNGKQVAEKYNIPYYHIKSRQWRLDVNFPVASGTEPYEHPSYYGPDVEKWIRDFNQKKTSQNIGQSE